MSNKPFVTDKQTLDDLNILGKFKNNSIFSIFNRTVTSGGERLLEKLFREPMTDGESIRARNEIFEVFRGLGIEFPVNGSVFAEAESYLRKGSYSGMLSLVFQSVRRRALFLMGLKEEYNHDLNGVTASLQTLSLLYEFLKENTPKITLPGLKAEFQKHLKELENAPASLRSIPSAKSVQSPSGGPASENGRRADAADSGGISWTSALGHELTLRRKMSAAIESLLDFAHELDVHIAVGNVSRDLNLQTPEIRDPRENIFRIENAYHPAIPNAVANTVSMDREENFIFLTGANMAGKSTIMKTIGVNFYLAHIGFPVAAESMTFSPKEGVFTSINVPDNLDMGYSHFYAEVLRVKQVAEQVASGKDLLIIFDELFKGTNVKDAFDATLAVSKSFSAYSNCLFIISTHIVEVGHELKSHHYKVQYRFMPTVMEGNVARYPYKIAEGISDDRHGMMIIRNEKILDILD